jgi:hypothetical protein
MANVVVNNIWSNMRPSNYGAFDSWYYFVDGSLGLADYVGYGGQPYWFEQELVKAYTAKKVRVYSASDDARDIKSFDILGSNTGAFGGEEDTLIQVTNQTGWDHEWREWDISNTTAYKYYRMANMYGNNVNWLRLYEYQLLAPEEEVEVMGIDQTTLATMSAGSGTPASCVDNNLGTYWATSTTSDWLQAYWAAGKVIKWITMQPTSVNSGRVPHNWTLKASNTGVFGGEEDTLLTVNGYIYQGAMEKRYWYINNETSYKYYRFDPISTDGTLYIFLAELELAGEGIFSINPTISIIV